MVLVLLVMVAPFPASAQTCDTAGLDAPTYRRVLHERFAALYSPKPGNNVPGTFAALDIKDAEATFANASVFASGAVLDVKARGAVAEGTLPFLSNQKVNGKLGLDIRLHRLGGGRTALQYTNASCVAYKAALLKTANDSAIAAVEIRAGYLKTQKAVDLYRAERKRAEAQKFIDTTAVPALRDSADVERAKADALADQVRSRVVPDSGAQFDLLRRNTAAARRAARPLLAIRGYTLGWWSFAYGLSNTSFRLFNPAAPFASQVEKRSYVSQSVGLTYSRYELTSASGESRFLSIGIQGGLADNLSSLRKAELTESTNFGPNPDDRVETAKYTAYQGTYQKNLATATLSADYYSFLLFRNQGAFHLYPAITVTEGARATYGLGTGFLVVARKEDKSIVNAELYFNLTDLTNASDSEQSFLGRSGLGLRFTFPITFGPAE
jgi:hypothetical protein